VDDAATGRSVVVAGSYHAVERSPVGPFAAVVAIPTGMIESASVIFLVILVGGGIVVVERTGVFRRGVNSLLGRTGGSPHLVVPLVCALFTAGGALEGMSEEIVAVVPALLLVTRGLGYQPAAAAAMSLGSAAVGVAFSPMNPFGVGIAQKLAGVDLLSGWQFRVAFLILAFVIWTLGVIRFSERTRAHSGNSVQIELETMLPRDRVILLLVLGCFAGYVVGVLRLDWGFEQMAAIFFLLGLLAGIVGGLRIRGTVDAMVDGFRTMAYAAVLIGFARAIYVVLNDGKVIDTIVHGLFVPIEQFPPAVAAAGMMLLQGAVHVPVPSTSGQAVLTMPVLVPLSDLMGVTRQVTVLAYQFGSGLCELLTPTNGSLMAVLAAAGVSYDRWIRFVLPLVLALVALALVALMLATALGLS
jgi:uncharacterized ion transporter superfamily protein YfcC